LRRIISSKRLPSGLLSDGSSLPVLSSPTFIVTGVFGVGLETLTLAVVGVGVGVGVGFGGVVGLVPGNLPSGS
jgi:hypothetical protein